MVPKIKERWIEALLSGKYEQGQRSLRTEDDKYCCLGVLCDVVDPTKWEGKDYHGTPDRVNDNEGYGEYDSYQRFEDSELSYAMLREVGISTEQELILIAFNDNQSKGFDFIAGYIRENL